MFNRISRLILVSLVCILPASLIASDNHIDQLKSIITTLTSPHFAGRNVPGAGGEATADFISQWLTEREEHGQELSTQLVPLQQASMFAGNSLISLSSAQNMLLSKWGDQFYIFPRKIRQIDLSSELLFCGYGISMPEDKRNDYPAEVRGKVAIVLARSDLTVGKVGMRANAAFKSAAAERAGALALVVVYTDTLWPPPELSEKIADSKRPVIDIADSEPEFPVAHFHMPGATQEDIKTLTRVNLRVSLNRPTESPARNIIVKQSGLIDEWIVVGAHYDHLGEGFPGADDNASGVAGILTLSERFGNKKALNRGILFVWFTAEEDGLLGSNWFVRNPPVDKEKIVTMINLDMIGREGFHSMRDVSNPDALPEKGYAATYFSAASPALQDVLRAAASTVPLAVNIQPVNSFRHFGDSAPFHNAQIPTMHIFSGFHEDYNSATDTPDKISYEKLGQMIDLTEKILSNLVEIPVRPAFDPSIKVENSGLGY